METAELERLETAATKARDAWSAKSDRLAEAQKEARELEEQLQRDYGPDDAFLALEVRRLWVLVFGGSMLVSDGSVRCPHFRLSFERCTLRLVPPIWSRRPGMKVVTDHALQACRCTCTTLGCISPATGSA